MSRDFLKDVKYDRALKVSDEEFVHNYYELLLTLRGANDSEFARLVGHNHERIVSWIRDNFQDEVLVRRLGHVRTRKGYVSVLEHRLRELRSEHHVFFGLGFSRVMLVLGALAIIVGFFFYLGIFEPSVEDVLPDDNTTVKSLVDQNKQYRQTINELRDRVLELEQRNAILEEALEGTRFVRLDERTAYIPRDRLNSSNIILEEGRISLLVSNAVISGFGDTGSMLPTITSGANAIELVPSSPKDVGLGDMISYERDDGLIIIHRVVALGYDTDGWYALVKGDNNASPDPSVVRFGQVRGVVVAVLY